MESQERLGFILEKLIKPKLKEFLAFGIRFTNELITEFANKKLTKSEVQYHLMNCLIYGLPYRQFLASFTEQMPPLNATKMGEANVQHVFQLLFSCEMATPRFDSETLHNLWMDTAEQALRANAISSPKG